MPMREYIFWPVLGLLLYFVCLCISFSNNPYRPHRMLAHLYCAEALIMLDRVLDARKFLEPKFIQELKEDDFVHRGGPDWPINTVDGAHAILTYNLAVTFLLQGEWDVARTALAQCHQHPLVLKHVKLALLYMELQAGNVENCRMMIRHDMPYLA